MPSATKNKKLDERSKASITQHLPSSEAEFKRYLPEPKKQEATFVRNPFSTALDELQDQFCDLQNDSSAHDAFQKIAISQFWCAMHESYSQTSALTVRILFAFATTYLDDSGFSALVYTYQNESTKLKES